jgi:hypothetical protein
MCKSYKYRKLDSKVEEGFMDLLASIWWVTWVILGIIFYGMFVILYQIYDIFHQRKHFDEIERKLSSPKEKYTPYRNSLTELIKV